MSHYGLADVNQRLFNYLLLVISINDEQMESNDSWQNKKYADQNLSIYHRLRLLSTIYFGKY